MRRSAWILVGMLVLLVSPSAIWGEPGQKWIARWDGARGSGGVQDPVAVRQLADGSVMMVALDDGTLSALRYDTSTTVWTTLSTANFVVRGTVRSVAIDPFGSIAVATDVGPSAGRNFWIRKYDGYTGRNMWWNHDVFDTAYANPPRDHTAVGLAFDSAGNVVVTGNSVNANGNYDIVTFKFSGVDGAKLWGPMTYDSGGSDSAAAIATDSANNVIVLGSAAGDVIVLKYNSANGASAWPPARWVNPTSTETPKALAIDNASDIVVTGREDMGTQHDVFTMKFSAATGTVAWGPVVYSSSASNDAVAVTTTTLGDVVVTGTTTPAYTDVFVVKYATGNGNLLWQTTYNDPNNGNALPFAINVDGRGDINVGINAGSPVCQCIVGMKLSGANGSELWHVTYGGLANSTGRTGAILSTGDLLTAVRAGNTNGDAFVLRFGNDRVMGGSDYFTGAATRRSYFKDLAIANGYTAACGSVADGRGNYDAIVAKYDANGTAVWGPVLYNGAADRADLGERVAMDGAGNVFLGGRTQNSSFAYDWLVAKYDGNSGALLWSRTYGNGGSAKILVTSNGDVIAIGGSWSTGTYGDITAIRYAGADGSVVWGPVSFGVGPGTDDSAAGAALTSTGDVAITGSTTSTSGDTDFVTWEISGTTGAVIWGPLTWNSGWGSSQPDTAAAVAVDPNDNVIVTGTGYGGFSGKDIITIKYSPSGTVAWLNRYDSSSYTSTYDDVAVDLAIDSTGTITVVGRSRYNTYYNTTLVRYSSSGTQLTGGSSVYPGNGDAQVAGVAIDGSGTAWVVSGSLWETGNYDWALYPSSGGNSGYFESGLDDIPTEARASGTEIYVAGSGYDRSAVLIRFTKNFCLRTATEDLLPGYTGRSYSYYMGVTSNGWVWSLIGGSLPPGLSLDTDPNGFGWVHGTPTLAGHYSFRVRAAHTYSGTVEERDGTIDVFDGTDLLPVIATSNPVCNGGSATLSVSGSYAQYQWLPTLESTPSIIVTPQAETAYGVVLTDASGATHRALVDLQVGAAAGFVTNVTASGPTTFCTGGSVVLNAVPAQPGTYVSYQWYRDGVQVATGSSYTATTSGTFTATATSWDGCTTGQGTSVSVTVEQPVTPVITASGPTTLCDGSSVTLTSSPAYSYLWSNGATTQSIVVTTAGTFTVTATSLGGCVTTSAPVTTSVNPRPAPVITATTDTCADLTSFASAYVADAGPGATYAWTIENGHITAGADTRTVTYQGDAPGTLTLHVTVTDANGCSGTATATTIVHATPSASITAPDHVCPGSTANTASVPDAGAGATYSWSITGGEILSGAGTLSITFRPASTSPVWLQVMVSNGFCFASGNTTVNVLTIMPSVTASGPTTFCQGGSVTLTAAPGGATYLWSTGATSQSITVTQSGDYSVTVSLGGCSATSAPVSVTVNPLPATTVTASGPTTFCAGGNVTLTAPAGYTYSWSNGATSQSITVSTTGSYSVTVTNANGCSATSTPTPVNANPLPVATITTGGPTTFCEGGSVTLTASAAASYLWSNGATTQSIAASASGSYSVTVTNTNGCGATSPPVLVTVNPNPLAPAITESGPTTFCAGGSVTLTAPAGYTYSWSNGATAQSIAVSVSGSYSVTVTNTNGCSATSQPVVVTVNPNPPAPVITPSGPTTFCAGGSVTLIAPAGYTYSWSNGATTQSVAVSAPGTFTVAVTNGSGCSATSAPVTVSVNPNPPAPAITPSGPTTFCEGGSVTLAAPAGYTYLWSNGATSQSIAVTQTGNYRVTVADMNGCSATSASVPVTVDPLPAATITAGGPTTFCQGGSVTLTASSGASYLWSNGATTQSITVADSGTFSVTVTNAYGCSATSAPTTVTVNPLPAATITAGGPTTFCQGGSVTLTASPGNSYLWSNGATTQSIVATEAGNYFVTVTTAGCSTTSSPTAVTVNPLPAATITAGGPTSFCQGGSVTLTASPGVSYLWSNGATTQSITVSTGGNYSVRVTNENGCSATSAATAVTVFPLPDATTLSNGPTQFCEGGSVTLTAVAGYTYLWSTGATTQSITVTQTGNYYVTVTNANGCSATSIIRSVLVQSLPPATITASGPTTFCEGGSVTLTAATATGYLWSTGETTQSITVTKSGSYTVTTTSSFGCTATSAPASVTVNPRPVATITPDGPTTFCSGGTVTLSAPAGYTYLWSNNATTQSIVVAQSGTFTVTLTDGNGCNATSAATVVTVNPLPVATITASGPTSFCNGGSVTLSAPAGYTYLWSSGETTQSINVTASGSYTVTITDANGCSATSAPTTVDEHPTTPVITASGSTDICPGTSVTLTAPAGYTYLWSNGAKTQSINVNQAGNYSVTIKDATGCTATSAPATVTVKTKTSIKQPANQSIHIGDTTTLTVTATGTKLGYQWYSGRKGDLSTPLGTSASQTVGPYSVKATYYFWVRVTGDCGTVDSNTINVTVN